eukprot:PhF_6_TR26620/c0_g2_i1/m.38525
MQHRAYWRPAFWNPFSEGGFTNKDVINSTKYQYFRGLLRSVPFNAHHPFVLNVVTRKPSWFSLMSQPVCVLDINNPQFFYGESRGCRTLVVPTDPANNAAPTKAILRLMQFNPSMDNLWLGKSHEKDYKDIAKALTDPKASRLGLKVVRLTLCHWTDAKAIAAVTMALRNVEILDLYGVSDVPAPDWASVAEDIQAICNLIEMHPKIRAVEGNQDVLTAFFHAVKESRCKHNVALVPVGDTWSSIWWLLWHLGVMLFVWDLYHNMRKLAKEHYPDKPKVAGACSAACTFGYIGFVVYEAQVWKYIHGPAWTVWVSRCLWLYGRLIKQ